MEHPVLTAIAREGFVALGWFAPVAGDGVPAMADNKPTRQVILIGNAGPAMFARFRRERDPARDSLDDWTRTVIDPLAGRLGARALYPFDQPAHAFLTWARRAGAGFTSPLGLNIHPVYGLWHAFRAALLLPVEFDLPSPGVSAGPCETCAQKPCLRTCPVSAFDGSGYDVAACAGHLSGRAGEDCMTRGCLARHACPVGTAWRYEPAQASFHMAAFLKARCRD
jgi:hypothetical protein